MRIREFMTEADFAAWKNNRNLNAPAGSTLSQANKNARTVPTDTPSNLSDLAKLGAPATPTTKPGSRMDLDNMRGALYKYTGLGGAAGNAAATRTKFIGDFADQYSLAQRSAIKGGIPFDTDAYIQSYLQKYKWKASPEQLTQLKAIKDPTKLANAIYAIGMQQSSTGSSTPSSTSGYDSMTPNKSAEDATVDPTSKQLIQTLKTKIRGPAYEADLREIIKQAMWNLYGADKQDYSEFVKSIMAGKTKQNPAIQQQDDNPNIVRGSNE